MSPELLQRIDALAAKLDVTAAHLWEVLIRQAWVFVVQTAVAVFVVGWVTQVYLRWYRSWKAGRKPYEPEADLAELGLIASGVTLAIAWLIVLILGIDALGALLNPEYYALSKILSAVN